MESVTIVSNGSKITEKWMEEFGYYLDIMAISVDSFDPDMTRMVADQEPDPVIWRV